MTELYFLLCLKLYASPSSVTRVQAIPGLLVLHRCFYPYFPHMLANMNDIRYKTSANDVTLLWVFVKIFLIEYTFRNRFLCWLAAWSFACFVDFDWGWFPYPVHACHHQVQTTFSWELPLAVTAFEVVWISVTWTSAVYSCVGWETFFTSEGRQSHSLKHFHFTGIFLCKVTR